MQVIGTALLGIALTTYRVHQNICLLASQHILVARDNVSFCVRVLHKHMNCYCMFCIKISPFSFFLYSIINVISMRNAQITFWPTLYIV